MMGIANQDLVFKLKSIGVRVEGDEARSTATSSRRSSQGKKITASARGHPARRADAGGPAQRRAVVPARRTPTTLLRPPARPRQRHPEASRRGIRTIPASERSAAVIDTPPPASPAAPPPSAMTPAASGAPVAAAPDAPAPAAAPPSPTAGRRAWRRRPRESLPRCSGPSGYPSRGPEPPRRPG